MVQTMTKTAKSPLYGPLMMVAASLLFSTGGLLCKVIPWSPLAINGVRNLFGAALIGCYLLATHHKLRFNKTVLAGAICMFGVTTLFVVSNKMTTAANAIVLQYTAPVWIILLMAVFFHTNPTKLDVITMCVVFVGILCFFFDSMAAGGIAGDLVAILSGLFYAGLFLMNSFETGDSLSSLFIGQLAGGILLSPFAFQETDFSFIPVTAVIVLGLFQVGLAYIFFNEGTRYTQPVAASLIAGIEPVLNPILVAVLWGETIQPLSLAGAVIVIAAILIYNARKGS